MPDQFYEQPILNSPYGYPGRHWRLEGGMPTDDIIERRRLAEYLTPIPKPKRQKAQSELDFSDRKAVADDQERYDPIPVINRVRLLVNKWREIPNPADWRVTPETARLLQHWRSHPFSGVRPFFCQVEAVETAIWLSEVAPS
ncbi:MAG: restriction endonuclease, partial [Planctomycetaceae bacterium]